MKARRQNAKAMPLLPLTVFHGIAASMGDPFAEIPFTKQMAISMAETVRRRQRDDFIMEVQRKVNPLVQKRALDFSRVGAAGFCSRDFASVMKVGK